MIELQDVYRFQEAGNLDSPPILRGVSLSIAAGERVAVMGRSGSGKSTLARLLNGLDLPCRGRVLVGGHDTCEHSMVPRVGYVFQQPESQLIAQTVEAELAFGLENLEWEVARIEARLEWALEFFRLAPVRQRDPQTLSGGQKQLLTLAAIAAMEPDIFVLDEVTSMLDPGTSELVQEILAHLHREEGKTVIEIVHDPAVIQRSQRLVVLERGRLVGDLAPPTLEALQQFGLGLTPRQQLALELRESKSPLDPLKPDFLADLCAL